MLQNVGQVGLVEAGGGCFVLFDVLKEFEEDLETDVGDVAHRVLERPNYAVEHQFELRRGDVEERDEAMVVDRLEQ